jgi:Tol biopolymer transport system component/DNA-binding SARP family transcriptional activator
MLLALFWPELDTPHARTSLRNALYVIRQALGDTVVRSRGDEEISIDPAMLGTDLARVWEALRQARPDEALAQYGGDLLPGLFPSDSEGFMRWLDTERTRIRVAVCSTGVSHLDELEVNGKIAEAVKLGRRIIEIQPDDETIVRRVLSLHEVNGDKAGALALYESYRARLAKDFDAEPAPETLAIVNRLRAASEPLPIRSRQHTKPATHSIDASDLVDPAIAEPVGVAPRNNRRRLAYVLAGAALVIVGGWSMSRQPRPLSIGASTPLTSDEGLQVQAAISPNGRLVAYAGGNPGRLRIVVQRIGGGAGWPLTNDSSAFEQMPRWSPDNDQVLFLSRYNAYVSPSIGGTPRIVARGSDVEGMVRSAAWSPTGDSIAIVRRDSLIIQPLNGTGSRHVGSASQLHSCVWSPSGNAIACVSGNIVSLQPGPLFGNEAPSAVVLFPVSGGKPVDISGHQFQHRGPAWSSDGRFLWLLSDRDGNAGEVYSIGIGRDGRAAGGFARAGLSAESIGMSASRMVYSVPVRRANIWSVRVPSDSVLSLRDATRITFGTALIEVIAATPDSRWIVYDSDVNGNADLFRVPVDGGEPERLTSDPAPEYAGALSPDGESLAWHRWVKGQRHLFVKRLNSDSEAEILPAPGDQGVPRWSPDGHSIAAWSHDKEEGAVFVVRRDARGQWLPTAWRLEGGQLPVWSADARTLAFVRYDGRIQTIPADSGVVKTIYAPREGGEDPVAGNLVWSLDPSTIWFIGSNARGHGGIWSVPASGGAPRLRVALDDDAGRLHGPMLATDGRRFLFTLDERFSNVRWAELVTR